VSSEFVDTNILIYAHDRNARDKQSSSAELLRRLTLEGNGAISVQVLVEFYAAATRKLAISSQVAQEVIADFGVWTIHRPGHADLIRAAGLHRRYKISWWDALIVNSALELGCAVLWSEDLTHGQRFGSMTVRNPFVD
jgi:predicted nucleic acid-binding protein